MYTPKWAGWKGLILTTIGDKILKKPKEVKTMNVKTECTSMREEGVAVKNKCAEAASGGGGGVDGNLLFPQ